MQLERLLLAIKEYHPEPNLDLIQRAYEFAKKAHEGQVRASGEPYFSHVYETAILATHLKLDADSVAAALLHDTIEDCQVDGKTLEKNFGKEIAALVEGVSNLTRVEFESKEEKQAENFRKMLISMAKDIRVILIKLCDRLHNMRTLDHMSEEKRRRKATETQEIYAPLANRLGLNWIKSELEDLCLRHLRPELYKEIDEKFQVNQSEQDQFIDKTVSLIKKHLEESGISGNVKGRAKHYFSIWQKMMRENLSFEEVHDLLGFRIIVPTLRACYETLGVIHSAFKPIPGRFKDYIAMPKPNRYQSLHTTVIGPEGQRIEIQIRTLEMHRVAEEGVAAHWRYKEGDTKQSVDLHWVKELVETQQYLKNPDEFIQSVKSELFPDEIFLFTPEGDLLRLPYDASPIDFAYAVHTDVGHTATGAKVNGMIVPLSHKLQNGDTVEIIVSKTHVPNKDWLEFVKSTKAKQRVRSFLKSEERAHSLAFGMEALTKDLKKFDLTIKKLEKTGRLLAVTQDLGYKTLGELYAEIGYGKIKSEAVIEKLLPNIDIKEKLEAPTKTGSFQRILNTAASVSREKIGVTVGGADNVIVRFAKCCEPIPGDRIIGFITRGRGVTVHHSECPEVLNCDPIRLLKVNWDNQIDEPRRVNIKVFSSDRLGLLTSVTKAITDSGADIRNSETHVDENQKSTMQFELLVKDSKQMSKTLRNIEMVAGVIKVERVITGK